MQKFIVPLRLTAAQLEAFYAGEVRNVWARTETGLKVQFPLDALRPYVLHDGVSGRFELTTDRQHRLQDIKRLG